MEEGIQGLFNACLFGKEDGHLVEKESGMDCGNFVEYQKAPILPLPPPPLSQQYWSTPSMEVEDESIPFLQMLQSVDSPSPLEENCFQMLLKLQQEYQKWPFFHQQTQTHFQMDPPAKYEPPTTGEEDEKERERFEMGKETEGDGKGRRKRKRSKPEKNREEVETQRMTHITVERNRRRQMNDHLSALRSLMPSSFVQRGDQASIIGGAINYVKELEQLLQSLEGESHKRERKRNRGLRSSNGGNEQVDLNEEEEKEMEMEIEMKVIQNHVNLKIECERNTRRRNRPNQQLVKAIVALESLRLTVLHLNITSMPTTLHYSFSLKIEEDCKVGSADEIARTVRAIFSTT